VKLLRKVKIRRYQDEDNMQVKNLHRLALESTDAFADSGKWDADLDNIHEVYIKKGEFLVGLVDGKVILMGALRPLSKNVVEMKRVRVHPDFQRQGLGQAMIELLERGAKELGFKTIQLDTTVNQTGAQKLYEKNGYVEIRRETEGWPMEVIFYKKELQ
jgi:ribosomal protein S18 acetylase RimI-like enzyme